MVDTGSQRSPQSTSSSFTTCSATFYRCIKQRLGCSLRGLHSKRCLVHPRKQTLHKLSGDEGSPPGSKEPLCQEKTVLVVSDNTTVVSYINKEGGMRSGSLCALMWHLLSWCSNHNILLLARHILGPLNMIAEKLSRHRRVIQTKWSLHQDVFDEICHRGLRLVRNQIQQITLVCLSGSGSEGVGRQCPQPLMRSSGSVCLSPSSSSGQGVQQITKSKLSQDDFDSPGVAQHAFVLRPSHDVLPDT